MTDSKLRALAIEILRRYQPIEPNEVTEEELQVLTTLLEAALKDAFKEGVEVAEHNEALYAKEARNEAIEEAAQVCYADTKPSKELCRMESHDDRRCSACEHINAEAEMLGYKIRQLKSRE